MDSSIEVSIVGASGAVGQQLAVDLGKQTRFEVVQLMASARHERRSLVEVAKPWMADDSPHPKIAGLAIEPIEEGIRTRVVFSALPSSVAAIYEPRWVEQGALVFSLAAAHRMKNHVPSVVVDVNPQHLEVASQNLQLGLGALICKPNCVAAILATFLKPLVSIGLCEVSGVSLQSLSGAGFPGPSAWQMCGDILPFIEGEAQKIETETLKVLGGYDDRKKIFLPLTDLNITMSCIRVPVPRGHSLQLRLIFSKALDMACLKQRLNLSPALQFLEDSTQLAPSRVMALREPMKVYWGNFRQISPTICDVWVVGDNLGRGASSGVVALAKHFLDKHQPLSW